MSQYRIALIEISVFLKNHAYIHVNSQKFKFNKNYSK